MNAKVDRRRTAAEIIAFHFGADIETVRGARYQPTRYSTVALYTFGDEYYCAPSAGQNPPAGFEWKKIGEQYGRAVYSAKCE